MTLISQPQSEFVHSYISPFFIAMMDSFLSRGPLTRDAAPRFDKSLINASATLRLPGWLAASPCDLYLDGR